MPGNDALAKTLRGAKAVLAKSSKDFPTPKATATTPAAPPAVKAAPAQTPRASLRQQNIEAVTPVMQQAGMTGAGTLGTLHSGGKVPKTGKYLLEEGETVIPADKEKAASRSSEYRKVYVARRQSRNGGGNTPAKGEKHDEKKAAKAGQAHAKKEGGHVG